MGHEAVIGVYQNQANLVIGKTAMSDLQVDPEFSWKDKSGNIVNNYHYTQADNTFVSYLPYISILLNATKLKKYDVILTFDKKNILKEKSVHYKEMMCWWNVSKC